MEHKISHAFQMTQNGVMIHKEWVLLLLGYRWNTQQYMFINIGKSAKEVNVR